MPLMIFVLLLNQIGTSRRVFFSGLSTCLQGRGTNTNESEPENTTENGLKKCRTLCLLNISDHIDSFSFEI